MVETLGYLVVIFYSLRKTAWKLWLSEILVLMCTSFKGTLWVEPVEWNSVVLKTVSNQCRLKNMYVCTSKFFILQTFGEHWVWIQCLRSTAQDRRMEKDWSLKKIGYPFLSLDTIKLIGKIPRILVWIVLPNKIHMIFSFWFVRNEVAIWLWIKC